MDLVDIFLSDVTVEMDDEGFDGIRDEVRVVAAGDVAGAGGGRAGVVGVVVEVVGGRHCWSLEERESEREGGGRRILPLVVAER